MVIAPFVLATLAGVLTWSPLAIPMVAIMLLAGVLAWRGRERTPELLRAVRAHIEADEAVLGDGVGLATGAGRGAAALRVVVATDRRLLLSARRRRDRAALRGHQRVRDRVEAPRPPGRALAERRRRDARHRLDRAREPAVDRASAPFARCAHRRRGGDRRGAARVGAGAAAERAAGSLVRPRGHEHVRLRPRAVAPPRALRRRALPEPVRRRARGVQGVGGGAGGRPARVRPRRRRVAHQVVARVHRSPQPARDARVLLRGRGRRDRPDVRHELARGRRPVGRGGAAALSGAGELAAARGPRQPALHDRRPGPDPDLGHPARAHGRVRGGLHRRRVLSCRRCAWPSRRRGRRSCPSTAAPT